MTTTTTTETTNLTAGRIPADWAEAVRINIEGTDQTLTTIVQDALNTLWAEVDEDGAVWSGRRWLRQDEVDGLIRAIDEAA